MFLVVVYNSIYNQKSKGDVHNENKIEIIYDHIVRSCIDRFRD